MNNNCKRKLKFWWFFAAIMFLHISSLNAQPATSKPILKYTINNYSTISKAVCDTCPPLVGKPLQINRPIPFPPVAGLNIIPGVDINEIPGLAAPNFWGGGSPEIKGLVKNVAGMTDRYSKTLGLGKND